MIITPAEFSAYLGAHDDETPAVSDEATAAFLELADEIQVESGQTLVRQFTPATHLLLLLDGEVRFEIQLDEGERGSRRRVEPHPMDADRVVGIQDAASLRHHGSLHA